MRLFVRAVDKLAKPPDTPYTMGGAMAGNKLHTGRGSHSTLQHLHSNVTTYPYHFRLGWLRGDNLMKRIFGIYRRTQIDPE